MQNTFRRLLLLLVFPCNFTKMTTANSVLKTSDEYSLPTNISLRITVQVNHFFLGSINCQSMFSFIYNSCLLPEAATGVEMFIGKGALKNSVNLTGNCLCCSLFLINLEAWQLFRRTSVNDCFCTALAQLTVTYSFYFIFSTYRSSHRRCSVKKVFLEILQNTCNFIEKETLAQVFSC